MDRYLYHLLGSSHFHLYNVAVLDSPTSKGSGNEVDIEQLLIWNPEAIIFNYGSIFNDVKNDSKFKELSAIKSNKVYETPYGPYNWTGNPPAVQRYLGMMWYANLLYP